MWNTYHYPPCFDTAKQTLASFHPSLSEPNSESIRFNQDGELNRKWQSLTNKFIGISKTLVTYQANPKRKHKTVPNAFGLSSSKDIRQFTRRDKELVEFLQTNKIINVFNVQSKSDGATRAFMLTDEMRSAVENFFCELEIDDRSIIHPEHRESGVHDLDKLGRIRRSAIQLPRWVSVNVDSIKKGLNECAEDDRSLLQLTYGTAKSFNGHLRQDYVESPFGRLYGRRSYESIQLMPKRLLKYVIPNNYVYDIKASAICLMSQIATSQEPSITTPTINEYVQNRKTIRESISRELGVDYDLIKQAFTALGFGARRVSHNWREKGRVKVGAIREILLGEEELTYQFLTHPFINNLTEEMDVCADVMLDTCFIDSSKARNRNQKIAYIYQNEEVRILQSMVSAALEVGCSIRSIKHDAIILNKMIPIEAIESRIEEDTGYQISLELEPISK